MKFFKTLLFLSVYFLGSQTYGALSCPQLLKILTAQDALHFFDFPSNADFRTTDTHLRRALYEAFGGIDYYTKLPMKFRDMSIDHVIPKSKGGPNNIFNYVPTSEKLNRAKGASFNWARDTKTLKEVNENYGHKAMSILAEQGFLDLTSGLIEKVVVEGREIKSPGYHVSFYGLTDLLSVTLNKIFSDISRAPDDLATNNEFDLSEFENLDLDKLEAAAESFTYDLIYVGADLREKNETSGPLLEVVREDEFGYYDDSKPVLRLHPQIIKKLKNWKQGMTLEDFFNTAHISRSEFEIWRAE